MSYVLYKALYFLKTLHTQSSVPSCLSWPSAFSTCLVLCNKRIDQYGTLQSHPFLHPPTIYSSPLYSLLKSLNNKLPRFSHILLIIIIDSLRLIFYPSSVTAKWFCAYLPSQLTTHTFSLLFSILLRKCLTIKHHHHDSTIFTYLTPTYQPCYALSIPTYQEGLWENKPPGIYRAWLHFTPYSSASISNHTSLSIECSSCREISYVGVQILHSCGIHHNNTPFNFETRLCPFPLTNCEALELVHSRSKESCHKMTVCEHALHANGLGTETAHIQHHIWHYGLGS